MLRLTEIALLAAVMHDEATGEVCLDKVRIDLDGSLEVSNRPIAATLFIPN
jgi:hypothetical protein